MESGSPHVSAFTDSSRATGTEPDWKVSGSRTSPEDLRLSQFEKTLPKLLWMAVAGFAAIIALSTLAAPVGKFDDAIPLLHGMLVQQGRTPNLDFYSFYPPLSLYLHAAVFSLLGVSVVSARLLADMFFLGLLLVVVWFFSSRYRPSEPLVPAAVLLVAASIGGMVTMPVWQGFSLALAALLVYLSSQGLERYRLWVVAGSGVLTGLALVSRINFGGYVAAVVMLDVLLRRVPGFDDRHGAGPEPTKETLLAFALPAAGCVAVVCLGVYGTDVGVGLSEFVLTAQRLMALRGFLDLRLDIDVASAILLPPLWFSFHILKGNSRLPAKAFVPAAVGLALLTVALLGKSHVWVAPLVVALEIAAVILFQRFVHRLDRGELGVLLFFCCVLHYFLSRADWDHFRVLPVVAALLGSLLVMSGHEARRPKFERTTARGTALAAMTAAALAFVLSGQFRPGLSGLPDAMTLLGDLVTQPHSTDADRVLGPTAPEPHWASVYQDEAELQALRYVRTRTSPSAPIFVGVENHSTVFWTDLRMYWLSGRPIGVKTFQLETRVATEAPVQRDIVADLERNQVMWIVLDSARDGDDTWLKSGYQGSRLLDDYIGGNFAEDARFGNYIVLRRSARATE